MASNILATSGPTTVHTSPQQQSRRSACDRCRGQKLRCIRDESELESCIRCRRAKVKCTTSPPRCTGRPSKSSLRDCGIKKQRLDLNRREDKMLASVTRIDGDYSDDNPIQEPIAIAVPNLTHNAASYAFLQSEISPKTQWPHAPLGHGHGQGRLKDPNHYPESLDSSGIMPNIHLENMEIPALPVDGAFHMGGFTSSEAGNLNFENYYLEGQPAMSQAGAGYYPPPGIPALPSSLVPEFDHRAGLQSHVLTPIPRRHTSPNPYNPNHNPQEGFTDDLDSGSSICETDLLEYCLMQLHELNREISRQLRLAKSHSWWESLVYDPQLQDQSTGTGSPRRMFEGKKTPMHEVLESSQQLLDVMNEFILPGHYASQDPLRTFLASTHLGRQSDQPMAGPDSAGLRRINTCPDIYASSYNPRSPTHPGITHSSPSSLHSFSTARDTTNPSIDPRPDTTIVILVLGCFIKLTRIYDSLFGQIYSLLASSGQQGDNGGAAAVYPNSYHARPESHDQSNLELVQMTESCVSMFYRLRQTLGIPRNLNNNSENGTDIFSNSTALAKLVETVMFLENLESPGQCSALDFGGLEMNIENVQCLLKAQMC